MSLVTIAQTLQNFNGVRNGWFFNLDRLETAFERSVFFEMLAIFLERCCTDGLQFAASKHRLEDAGCVDCTFGGTGTNERVDLVDEKDDVAAGLDFLEHLLETLFEIAAVTRTGNECTEIKRVQLLTVKRFGNLIGSDCLCETFNDCSLANTRFANKNGVVLGTAAEHLHDAFGFACTTNNWVEFLFASELCEVATELIEHGRTAWRCFARTTAGGAGLLALLRARTGIARQQLDDLLTHAGKIGAELDEHLRSDTLAFTDETEKDVFGADVVVTELQRFTQRQFEHLLGTRRKGDVAARR
ncbi:unannotated protein [freshwater metagenome]|uniref:Unannotated protein n=1 Tax=freshwater metagenome TaxID=449393 RepID=A0A6J7JBV9_9ZZZZ